ncbi:hypothetical protein TNCV_2303131 [Trichonephila clavipes]|nr:hypothetical protein TNCV_2303131 [Trichonephila clavipes]
MIPFQVIKSWSRKRYISRTREGKLVYLSSDQNTPRTRVQTITGLFNKQYSCPVYLTPLSMTTSDVTYTPASGGRADSRGPRAYGFGILCEIRLGAQNLTLQGVPSLRRHQFKWTPVAQLE